MISLITMAAIGFFWGLMAYARRRDRPILHSALVFIVGTGIGFGVVEFFTHFRGIWIDLMILVAAYVGFAIGASLGYRIIATR